MIQFKQAKFNDYWRKSSKRNFNCFVNEFKVNSGGILVGAALNLTKGLTSIAGKNGVGKSTLIASLYNSLANENSNRIKIKNLIEQNNIEVKVSITRDGKQVVIDSTELEDGEVTPYLFDPCSYIPTYLSFVRRIDNLDEQLEQVGARNYSDEQLLNINYLTNTEYTSVKVWNIEQEYEEHPVFPIFEVEKNGVTYQSSTMGIGEVSLLYFFWLIERIASVNEHSLLLIEEPESYLPPKTQKRLMNCLAWLIAEKGVSVVLSTHSEHILSFISPDRINLMIDSGTEKQFHKDFEAVGEILELGLQKTTSKKGLLCVEDEAALILIKEMLGELADLYSYEIAGSEGDLKKRCEVFMNNVDDYKFRAVFDGDSRGKFTNQLGSNHVDRYLPTNLAPDELIHGHFLGMDNHTIAADLGVAPHRINIAKESSQGVDFHDYFREVSKSLPIDEDELFAKICRHWCINNQAIVQEFIESL
ncbi:ATP-dependent nuclease [Vibrio cholerae]|uniref:ATP-dependent nuclease n=1 Tax=Vibrio cholerae TaxID=666 RepID=UPI001A2AB25A|nr:AAA family ATPase [Vibrio cholerae]EGQ9438913.1 AAA family ATPase [Vibrio cholerae]